MQNIFTFFLLAFILVAIFLDVMQKIDLSHKAIMSILLIFLPHIVLIAHIYKDYCQSKHLVLLYFIMIVSIIYIWIKVNVFPASKKYINSSYIKAMLEGRKLILYSLYSFVAQIPFYLILRILNRGYLPSHVLTIDAIITVIFIGMFYLNGMARILIYSKILNYSNKFLILVNILIPFLNIIFVVYLLSITKIEYKSEFYKSIKRDIRVDSSICKTKYPILMVHGTGFKDLKYLNYWGRIPKELIRNGAEIFYGNQEAWAKIEYNAEFLKRRITNIIKISGCKKVNIIAHSKGGLEARYLISRLGMSDYVASLTTICTPHRGSELADIVLKIPRPIFKLISNVISKYFKLLGDKNTDVYRVSLQLSKSYCEHFNKEIKNCRSVYYQSYASVMNNIFSDYVLTIPYILLWLTEGENDGLVTIESSKWGEFKGVIKTRGKRGVSHEDVVDLKRKDYLGFDISNKYVEIVAELKNKGF